MIGAHVETTADLTTLRLLTAIRSLTSRTLHLILLAKPSSPKLILCVPITKFQSTTKILLRPPSLHPLASLNSNGQFTSVDLFVKKCRVDIQKLNFNKSLKFSNLSKEEWTAHQNLKTWDDIVIKPADKGGAVVVWRTDLYKQEAFRQLADTKFYAKVNKDLTQANQKIVKDTVNKLILEQKLPSTARNLFITTPKTSTFYLKPKIHKPNNPGRPIISACSCPTELISSFLDKKMAPFVKSLPTYIKDTNHALNILKQFSFPGNNKFSLPWTSPLYILLFRTMKGFWHLNTFSTNASSKNPQPTHYFVWLNLF